MAKPAERLVVTPMQAELDALVKGCIREGASAQHGTIGRLPVVRAPDLGLTFARGGLGKAQLALQTQHLLDARPRWDGVVCAGGAGALSDELAVGDVVVATATVEHDYRNRFNDRPLPRFDAAPDAVAALECVAALQRSFKVRFGTVASGDEDVIDVERRGALRASTGALAVAWEGAGGARACAFSGVPFVEIRAITDAADPGAPSDFYNNLELAMSNLAALVTSWVRQERNAIVSF